MAVFTQNIRLSFRHCDPAGLVFHPRYVEMISEVVEAFFADILGWSYKEMHGPDSSAVPTVNLNMDLKSPAYLHDALELRLTITHLGTSSVKINVVAQGEDGLEKFNAISTMVRVKRSDGDGGSDGGDDLGMSPAPWPEDVRAKLEAYVV